MVQMNIIKNPTDEQINNIISQLKRGEVIVYPTDTIYGLAVNIYDENAIKKVYKIKQRSKTKPLSACFHNLDQIKQATSLNSIQEEIIGKLLPGPYTFLVKKNDKIPNILTSNTEIIGVRIPDNQISYNLTKEFPITSTSANISNKPTPNNIYGIKDQLKDDIITYIDSGILSNSMPSTIIDLTKQYPKIIRKGKIDNTIENILKIKLF